MWGCFPFSAIPWPKKPSPTPSTPTGCSISEIERTIRLIIEQQMAMDKEELMRLTAKQLGFSHRGARIDSAIEQAMNNLLKANLINANGTKISQVFHD